jgi:FkbM family methyltransferase
VRKVRQLLRSEAFRRAPFSMLGRTARLASDIACRRRHRAVTVALPGGASFRFEGDPCAAAEGARGLMLKGAYYEPLLARAHEFVGPGHVVIDGGANTGIFTCAFASLGATVMAAEPLPGPRETLERNLAANRLAHRCHVVPAALSDAAGEAEMDLGKGAVAASLVNRYPSPRLVPVTVTTIDAEVLRLDLGHVDLIKLDIEGAEPAALRGARDTIDRHRPLICVEVWHEDTFAAMRALLEPRGYRFAVLGFDGAPAPFTTFRPEPNLLALPERM